MQILPRSDWLIALALCNLIDSEYRKPGFSPNHQKYFVEQFLIEAQFKRRTFHVPNLIPSIKYMKRSTFESIEFDIFNLGRPKN